MIFPQIHFKTCTLKAGVMIQFESGDYFNIYSVTPKLVFGKDVRLRWTLTTTLRNKLIFP